MEELLKQVNSDVRGILAEAEAHGENPRLVALMRAVIKLTNSPEDAKAEAAQDSEAEKAAQKRAEIAAQIADLQKSLKAL